MINATYQTSPPPAVAYELKTCELCTRNFTRQVGTQIKYCRPCSAKQAAAGKTTSTSEERERKKPPRRTLKPRASSLQKRDRAQELRTAWLKSVTEKKDPANEIRDAWLLH